PLRLSPRLLLDPPATPDTHPLSLHDALPISLEVGEALPEHRANRFGEPLRAPKCRDHDADQGHAARTVTSFARSVIGTGRTGDRSEEHTSELQSRENLVCRLLLEKKKKTHNI